MGTYSYNVAVDEVILTFHAADAQGHPIQDLKQDEVSVLDDGKPPHRIVNFQLLQDLPVRAAVLMDTSESMAKQLAADKAIAAQYAERLLRQRSDRVFVMDFGRLTKIVQPWTGDPTVFKAGLGNIRTGDGLLGGTAIYDMLYRSCRYEFGKVDYAASGNFILLFSDGEDNASYMSLKDAVSMCQNTNTAIYAFRARSGPGSLSLGSSTLTELAAETGGRVFSAGAPEAEIEEDLRSIEADLRNRYRLIFTPANLKHDGAYHHIELTMPDRALVLNVRSGYYAPGQPAGRQ